MTILAGALFTTEAATRFFLPAITIIMAWNALRAVLLFFTSRRTGDGVRRWTLIAAPS